MSQKHVYLIYLSILSVLPCSGTDGPRELVTIDIDPSITEYSHGVGRFPPVFRPGSGAVVALATPDPLSSLNKHNSYLDSNTLKYFTLIGAAIIAVLTLTMMLPGNRGGNSGPGGNNRDYQYRIPPYWLSLIHI